MQGRMGGGWVEVSVHDGVRLARTGHDGVMGWALRKGAELQWGNIMESVGASDRVIEFLDRPVAVQLSKGVKPKQFKGNVSRPFMQPCSSMRPAVPALTLLPFWLLFPCMLLGLDPPLITSSQGVKCH